MVPGRLTRVRSRNVSTELETGTHLRLPSLSIKGFRGIGELEIPRLSRVTLFAGKNGVGKTTLLDAIQVYAARGRYSVLTSILRDHEELTDHEDEDGRKEPLHDWEALFYGRDLTQDSLISIGPVDGDQNSTIEIRTAIGTDEPNQMSLFPEYLPGDELRMLNVKIYDRQRLLPMYRPDNYPSSLWRHRLRSYEDAFPPEIACESLGPGVLNNTSMARFWDEVALTDHEARAVQALQLMLGNAVQRVAVVGDDRRSTAGRRAIVRIAQQDRPVPLKSLGDGAVRIFGVAIALANSKDGFLVIDEAENGIHHSVQRDFWRMVLQTAHDNNVQVFATTHGWSCVAGFAQAAADMDEVDGALVRIERRGNGVRAISYSEDELEVAARQGIEVR